MQSDFQPNQDKPLFEAEIALFEKLLPQLLESDAGRYALIYGSDFAGCWDTFNDALQVGYSNYGLNAFMIRQVLEQQPVYNIFSFAEASISRKNLLA